MLDVLLGGRGIGTRMQSGEFRFFIQYLYHNATNVYVHVSKLYDLAILEVSSNIF